MTCANNKSCYQKIGYNFSLDCKSPRAVKLIIKLHEDRRLGENIFFGIKCDLKEFGRIGSGVIKWDAIRFLSREQCKDGHNAITKCSVRQCYFGNI